MKKFWKSLFTIAAISGASYVGYKGYKRISSVTKLSKSLPDYLENVIGEKPKVSISMTLNQISISLGISQEAYDKELELESLIREYIEDFYPSLAKVKSIINTYIRDNDDIEDDFDTDMDDATDSDGVDE
ncbi:MAG TPA: hypothetical protein PL063_01645 [Candidatus Cloacimonadota bacterium]|jgi:DNA-binding phage protein|nr:hypothetical protein [Candidatus Cloacimonadales bacterium]HPY95897.1 hypothetical protein [Candidatus Cloacimonadota bacterium]HQB41724.1 hypothetical protein [Candidatus Cloacimonadota bacterium]